MKPSELKATTAQEIVQNEKDCDYMDELFGGVKMPPTQVYLKAEVDKVIAEKDAKILALEADAFKQKHHAELFLDERNYAETQLSQSNRKLEEQESLIKEMKEAAARIGFKWQEYDAGEDAWEDEHKGRWVKAE